jgi:hypothetical protein
MEMVPFTSGMRKGGKKKMGKRVDIPCDEILSELIIEEGEVVYGLLTSTC